MKFSEMKYERPDLDAVIRQCEKVIGELKNAQDPAAAKAAFKEKEKLFCHIETMAALCNARYSLNTRDEFYTAEKKFWNEAGPRLEEYSAAWRKALLETPFRKQLEAELGELIFRNAEIEQKTFSPEIIPLMIKENELVQAYDTLCAKAQIPFEGKIYNLSNLNPRKTSTDDAVRLGAWKAEGKWFADNKAELDRIYDELVKLRDEMGKKLGYGGFTQLGYYRMGRNCYDKNDVEKFRAAVVKYIVPLATEINRKAAERLGKDFPMNHAEGAIEYRSGNARPVGTPDEILAHALTFYEELSPETGEFFRMMMDNELLDVLAKDGKQMGGYTTEFPEYKVPFIFANFNGTQHDVEVCTHEAGHAFEGWLNRDRFPSDYVAPTLEGCEVHSMSMEFFADPWAELFFGKDTKKYLYSHLAGSVDFIPYGTMVDHYQHIVYEKPEMTPDERHAVWKELMGIYQPWIKLDGEIPVYGEGHGWQRQLHIYEVPFYYIDYCLAQTVALQIWALKEKDFDNAWKTYMAYTSMGGSKTFTDLLKAAGLKTPFDEDCLKEVSEAAMKWLEAFDLSGVE